MNKTRYFLKFPSDANFCEVAEDEFFSSYTDTDRAVLRPDGKLDIECSYIQKEVIANLMEQIG